MSSELARIAGPVAAAGLVVLLLAPTRTYRLAGLVAWAAGLGALAVYLEPGGHAALLGAAAVAGLVLAGVGAALLVRWPWLLALAVLACVPARIPVSVGSTDANLLVPLYGVVVAAALALAWELLKGDDAFAGARPGRAAARRVRRLERPLARLGHTTSARARSSCSSSTSRSGCSPSRSRASTGGGNWARVLYGELILMALVFALVGIEQWINRDIFWNPKLLVGNTYAPFFRVNSVFWDPSIYGRFLVVAILASLVVALFSRSPRAVIAALIAIAAMWIGLLFSFSQSSFIALIAGARRGHGVRLALAGAHSRGRGRRGVPRRRRRRAERAPRGHEPRRRRPQPRDERPLEARLERRQDRRSTTRWSESGSAASGTPTRSRRASAGRSRPRPPRTTRRSRSPPRRASSGSALLGWLARRGLPLHLPPRRARPRGHGRARLRARARLDRRAQPLLQRVLRGPDRLGRARPGRGRLAAAEGAAEAAGSAGGRDERPQPPQLDRQVEAEREQDQRVDGRQGDRARERDVERLPERG